VGALHFADNKAAKHWFDAQIFEDTAILLKGSRGICLEYILAS
jgi:UDP-N-acetylmuramyl pentapeptide synthase